MALAGRRIDAPGATPPRFPLASVARVRGRIGELLEEQRVSLLVCSAACGADLLALEAAEALGIRGRIVLPFDRDRFRESSVTDRPGDWGERYDRLTERARLAGDLVVLEGGRGSYAAANDAILAEALRASGGAEEVVGAIVWDGRPRGDDDLTAAFAESARRAGVPVVEIPTLANGETLHR